MTAKTEVKLSVLVERLGLFENTGNN